MNLGSLTAADGVFFLGSAIGFCDLTDGSSETAAFSERTLGPGMVGPDLRQLILERTPGADPTPADCSAGAGSWNVERGAKWILGNYGNTLYNHYFPPNALGVWDCMNVQQQKGLMSARSGHAGGVNVLFCDGGVRFVRNDIQLGTWRSIATRSGGEMIEE